MSKTPMKLIVDLSKPKGEREELVPLTQKEIDEAKAMAAQAAIEQAEREAEEQRIADLKASAKAKLVAGEPLTADEAAVLVF
jgi:hypothetical protein